jgi:hypothetical protein
MNANILKVALNVKGKVIVPDETALSGYRLVVVQGASEVNCNDHAPDGTPRQIRAYVRPTDPRSPAQIIQRQKMAIAVAMWHAATPEDKEPARHIAKARNITLYMAFLSMVMPTITPGALTIWDDGATVWNSGLTVWNGA